MAIAEAIAAGIPVLLSDRPAHNGVFESQDGVIWCSPTAHSIAAHLQEYFLRKSDNPPRTRRNAERFLGTVSAELGAARYAYVYAYLARGRGGKDVRGRLSNIQAIWEGNSEYSDLKDAVERS